MLDGYNKIIVSNNIDNMSNLPQKVGKNFKILKKVGEGAFG